MTSPTEKYQEMSRLVGAVLKEMVEHEDGFCDLESRFECSRKDLPPMAQLPDYVALYSPQGEIVGEIYFTKDPMEVKVLDESFKHYGERLEWRLGLKEVKC